MIREIRNGRIHKTREILPDTKGSSTGKKGKKSRAADAAAIACAVLCAATLCLFGAREDASSKDAVYLAAGGKTLGAITYTPPEQPEEWSFWDYFADVMAGVFGYND